MPQTPNNGPAHGRNRNSMKNRAAGGAPAFPLSPSERLALGIQRSNLFYDYNLAKASLKGQAKLIKGQYGLASSGIRSDVLAGISDTSGVMAERGISGSAVHQAGVEDVQASGAGALAEARLARDSGLLDVNQSRLAAESQLRLGLRELILNRSTRQRELGLASYASGGRNPWGY